MKVAAILIAMMAALIAFAQFTIRNECNAVPSTAYCRALS